MESYRKFEYPPGEEVLSKNRRIKDVEKNVKEFLDNKNVVLCDDDDETDEILDMKKW